MWGVYDTVDNCWIGDADGPKTFTIQLLARAAAQLFDMRMSYPPGRHQAREYDGGARELKDTVEEPKMTAREALRRIMKGEV